MQSLSTCVPQAMFQMIHMFLEEPRWEDTAMERAKLAFLASVKWVDREGHGMG